MISLASMSASGKPRPDGPSSLSFVRVPVVDFGLWLVIILSCLLRSVTSSRTAWLGLAMLADGRLSMLAHLHYILPL